MGIEALSSLDGLYERVAGPIVESAVDLAVEDMIAHLSTGEGALPVGATGAYRRGLTSKSEGSGLKRGSRVFSTAAYAFLVEKGRGPTKKGGGVPLEQRLEQWSKQRGLDSRAVAFSIHRRGTLRFRTGKDSRGKTGEWGRAKRNANRITAKRWEVAAELIAKGMAEEIERAAASGS